MIEEIARFRLEEVPFTLPARREMNGLLTRDQQLRRRVEDTLVGLGFAEIYTPSLRPDDETTWKLPEPISVELTALRTSLLPSLVEAAARNVDAGSRGIALFEIARVYRPDGDLPAEAPTVAGIAEGAFLHAKGVVEALYSALKAEPAFTRTDHPLLHPGKAASTGAGDRRRAAPAGARRPVGRLRARPDDAVRGRRRARSPTATSSPTPPSARTSPSTVAEEVPVGNLVAAAREAAGEELREIRVFDVYRGEQVGSGRKSVAFSVAYQSADRTLTEEDATRLRGAIVTLLADRYGAELRG